jgi:hypothetical protein
MSVSAAKSIAGGVWVLYVLSWGDDVRILSDIGSRKLTSHVGGWSGIDVGDYRRWDISR